MRLLRSVMIFVFGVTPLWPQVALDEEPTAPESNMRYLQTTISMDHTVYAPGELATLTISVVNPADRTLEVLSPFWPERSGIDILEKARGDAEGDLEYRNLSPHPYSAYTPWSDDHTVLLQPQDRLTRTTRSDAPVFSGRPLLPTGCVPLKPGQYRLAYSYDPRAYADFIVREPLLEDFASLAVKRENLHYEDNTTEAVMRGVNVFAVSLGGKHVVLESTATWAANSPVRPRVGEPWSGVDPTLPPYERIGESEDPIHNLRLETEPSGDVLVKWQDSRGDWIERKALPQSSVQN